MNKDKLLLNYEKACNQLMIKFLEMYICDADIYLEDLDYFWIADEIGTVLSVSDMFIDMQTMVEAFQLDISKEKFMEYYWYRLECHQEGNEHMIKYNMRSYMMLKEDKDQF